MRFEFLDGQISGMMNIEEQAKYCKRARKRRREIALALMGLLREVQLVDPPVAR